MKKIVTIIFILTVISCSDNKKDKEEALLNEVLDIHDEVMPEMGTIRKNKKALQDIANQIAEEDSVAAQKLNALASKCAKANESMMSWMRSFQPIEKELPHDSIMNYYLLNKESITAVKENMQSALKESNSMLEKYEDIPKQD